MGGRPEVRLGSVSRPHGDMNPYHDVWHGSFVLLVMTNVGKVRGHSRKALLEGLVTVCVRSCVYFGEGHEHS